MSVEQLHGRRKERGREKGERESVNEIFGRYQQGNTSFFPFSSTSEEKDRAQCGSLGPPFSYQQFFGCREREREVLKNVKRAEGCVRAGWKTVMV